MTCAACGARNADSAAWCSQCLRPLGDATGADHPADTARPGDAATTGPDARSAASPGSAPTDRAFRTVDGEVEWRCPDCDAWNVFLVPVCARCGHRLGGGDGDRTDRTRQVLWVVAAAVGAVVVVGVVLVVLALRGAPSATPDSSPAPEAVASGGIASTATSCPPATCGDP